MKKGRKDEIKRYVKLDDEMTNAAAWTTLSFKAVWVYIELRKQFNYNAGGNDHLILPYSQAAWKMNRATFSRAIKELIEYGFIRIIQHGGLPKIPNIFALSNRWEEKSREIVKTEGREAIKLGLAQKPSFKDNSKNLKKYRKRKQEKRQVESQVYLKEYKH